MPYTPVYHYKLTFPEGETRFVPEENEQRLFISIQDRTGHTPDKIKQILDSGEPIVLATCRIDLVKPS
jgi:hypothetical protein